MARYRDRHTARERQFPWRSESTYFMPSFARTSRKERRWEYSGTSVALRRCDGISSAPAVKALLGETVAFEGSG